MVLASFRHMSSVRYTIYKQVGVSVLKFAGLFNIEKGWII